MRMLPLLLLMLPAALQAEDYTYVTNNGAITITGYTGSGGDLVIPSTITGLSVTCIGYEAFRNCGSLTSVRIPNSVTSIEGFAFRSCGKLTCATIPSSVTNIGYYAFYVCSSLTNVTIPGSVSSIGVGAFSACGSLTAITVDALNSSYSSVDGVLFNKGQTTLIQCPGRKAGSYTIPNSITSIGDIAFASCWYLTGVTIGSGVTSIGQQAFYYCTSLTGVYFNGNAPSLGLDVFYAGDTATIHYLPGTTGWGTAFGGRPTALWVLPNPLILNNGPSFGVQTNRFGFIISWATNLPVVVEICTNLSNPIWSPLQTNTLIGGSSYFSDPQWTNYPSRFYRIRSP